MERRTALPTAWIVGGLLGAGWLGWRLGSAGARAIADSVGDWMTNLFTQDPYAENFLEAVVGFRRIGVLPLLETDLRTASPRPLKRPLGAIRKNWPHLDELLFDFAQLERLPLPHDEPIDSRAVIGPRAERPLITETPLLISGMGYGVALSKGAKVALARASTIAGTATNTGEGPFLPEERQAAKKLIMQYHRGNWMRLEDLQHADAVEIHLGQGASGGGGKEIPDEEIDASLRRRMGLRRGEHAVSYSRFPGMERGRDLARIVERARRHAPPGVPVGVKLGAGFSLERDLSIALDAGVDFVALDGAQAGTHGSLPTTEDDFGAPTLIGLVRARRFLDRHDPDGSVSLIIGGGLVTPGECLKCLALGADAIYLGSAVMYGLVVGQHKFVIPFEPPTSLIMYRGRYKGRFDPDWGAKRVGNLLRSMTAEMCDSVRAMGYRSLRDLSPDDLISLNREIARFLGVPYALEPDRVDAALQPV